MNLQEHWTTGLGKAERVQCDCEGVGSLMTKNVITFEVKRVTPLVTPPGDANTSDDTEIIINLFLPSVVLAFKLGLLTFEI